MTAQSTGSVLPPVTADVAATALDPLPPRLRKRVDGAVAKAAAWPVDATENGDGTVIRAVVRVDDETTVTLVAPHGTVTTADDVTCTCLLAPACLHRAAVLLRAPLAEEAPGVNGEETEPSEENEPSNDTPGPTDTAPPTPPPAPASSHPPLTPPQTTATRTLWAATTDVLVAGVGGAGAGVGAVHRARLLHAAHSARLADLHRPAAAAVRVARRLGEASAEDPAFRLTDLTQEVTELLHVLRELRTRHSAGPTLTGTARRAYRPEQPLRLYGLCTEPVVTASGYAGAVTYALAPDGTLRTVSDVAPGGPDRVLRAAGSSVPGGCALSLRDLGDSGGATLTAPTVSPDGRIGAGNKVRSVRAPGAAWSQSPLDDLWQRPPHDQLARTLAWLATPVEERTSAGGDLVFLRGTVTATGLVAVLGGPTLRLLAPDERPELPYAENLRLLTARPGLPLRVIARVSPDRPGGVLALAAAWTGHDGRTFRADLGLRRLDTTQLPPHTEPAAPQPAARPPALPAELGLLRRAVDRAVAGGRRVAAADTGGELPRRLRAVGLTTGALTAQRLTATAADREHDALGRLRPADPDAYAEAWLAASLYTRAATASLLTAAWAPPPVPILMES